jgi:hypothetical protein
MPLFDKSFARNRGGHLMKKFFRLKPQDFRLFLAIAFCAVFFIGQDANEDKICATHKYGNLVIQNKASDKKLEVKLAAVSYEEHGLYNRYFDVDTGQTLQVNDIRTGIYLCLIRAYNPGDYNSFDFRSLMITIDESKTTTISYP